MDAFTMEETAAAPGSARSSVRAERARPWGSILWFEAVGARSRIQV